MMTTQAAVAPGPQGQGQSASEARPRSVRFGRPQYRHGVERPPLWVDQMLNPLGWRAGHWALLGVIMTFVSEVLALFYLANMFGVDRQFEIQMWLLVAGLLGFASITLALYAIVFNSGRGTGIFAFLCSLVICFAPAWLVGNTVIQLIINGGRLPHTTLPW